MPHLEPFSLHPDEYVKSMWRDRDVSNVAARRYIETLLFPPTEPEQKSDHAQPREGSPVTTAPPALPSYSPPHTTRGAPPVDNVGQGMDCSAYRVQLDRVSLCPILNGLWTSFLDPAKWGEETEVLPSRVRTKIAEEMRRYDRVGLDVWVGEDFDWRVLSALAEHRCACSVV